MSFWSLLKELWAGKTISRTLMNITIERSVKLSDNVLDIGGIGIPSYRRFLKNSSSHKFFVLDIAYGEDVDIVGSVTHLPIKSKSCGVILCFNVLEHVFSYQEALNEIKRTLNPNGTFYGYIPFLKRIHEVPSDHWRYTKETLRAILTGVGFKQVSIETQGGLFLVLFDLLSPVWVVNVIRITAGVGLLLMNRLFTAVASNKKNTEKYPLGYFFIAK